MITGTSYFKSLKCALNYYTPYEGSDTREAVQRKLAEGQIHIGLPPLKPGQRLIVIDGGRYAIED